MNSKFSELLMIKPRDSVMGENERLAAVLTYALESIPHETVHTAEEFERFLEQSEQGSPRRLLFAVDLGEYGINAEYYRLLGLLRSLALDGRLNELPDERQGGRQGGLLTGCTGGLLIDGKSELYTKNTAKELVFAANRAGCAFVGRPLVEGTKILNNFMVTAKNMGTDCRTAYRESARRLAAELAGFHWHGSPQPELLVLHASSHATSNTYALWTLIKSHLEGITVTEIGLRNGTLADCSGCPFQMCLHFGEQGSCFYGGVMVEEVYPAVKRADAVLMLCPNYNDALSANLTAFINRLTALFRTTSFHEKALFAIIVSGYSGGDIVAGQLIAALNMNKTFYLPGHFAMLETANDAGTVLKLPGIGHRAEEFAGQIKAVLGTC